MNRSHLFILTATLTVLGVSIFLYKLIRLNFPLTPHAQTSVWTIEASVSFNAKNKPAKVSLFIPKNTSRLSVMDENFISRGFGLATAVKDSNRQAVWSIRKAQGRHNLFYRAVVRQLDRTLTPPVIKQPELIDPGFEGAAREAAEAVLAEIKARSADTETLVKELLVRLNDPQPDENVRLLLGKKPSSLKKAETAVRILAKALLPARVAHGIDLRTASRNAELIHWLEIYENKSWRTFDPRSGQPELPSDYLPWWNGTDPLISVEGGDRAVATVSVEAREEEGIDSAIAGLEQTAPLLLELSLFSLPLKTQMVYRILLLIPIGALLVVLLRNLVGIKTFGTFMPILIALAFRETELLWGIIFFILLVGLGLAARFYLEHLKLLLVPRLASVLIVIILLMATISVLSHKLGIGHGISIALFPMVILTMTVERMSIVWDELGPQAALKQGLGTLFVASLTYLLITVSALEHLVFVFPELLLIVLAATILMGRYTGYRLLELPRFRALAGGGL